MPLKLTCPQCGGAVPLHEPLPLPGTEVKCVDCASGLAVTYPPGIIERLQRSGKRFASENRVSSPNVPRPEAPARRAQRGQRPEGSTPSRSPRSAAPGAPDQVSSSKVPDPGPGGPPTFAATHIDRTSVDPTQIGGPDSPHFSEIDRTVASGRTPYGALPGNVPEPEGEDSAAPPPETELTTRFADLPAEDGAPTEADTAADDPLPRARHRRREEGPMNAKRERRGRAPRAAPSPRRGRWIVSLLSGSLMMGLAAGAGVTALVGAGAAIGGYLYFSRDLPTVEKLRGYEPPTVTVVTDAKGEVLGEIFDQRRYVVPVDAIPEHVKHAFLAAEDANFYEHGGVDYLGIVRAMLRNARQGRMAQGASTITQQVARNFLLTRDKKLERKIKEVILSWRIENTYSKDHILYLYLNEIFLGSQAYGVEAASRAYFGKSVRDVTVAEAALLAGLPQRPSDYSPHRHWDRARERQEYVVGQMVAKGYLTAAEGEAALAEHVQITGKENVFLEQAPHFTEHVRRYLVERYGEDKVLREGLQVKTTCDLDLQRLAQRSVTSRVDEVDQRMGFRRAAITHVDGDAAIAAKRKEHEEKLRERWAEEQDPARRVALPDHSTLAEGDRLEGVLLEVTPKWARVGIGDHEGIIPIAWSDWVYEPNPRKSWRGRTADDLTAMVDVDDDGKLDGPILQKGDVVQVRIEGLDTRDSAVAKAFVGTPGETRELAAVRLWQDAEVESALFSLDLATGAVRAMVGGADFTTSQFNRAVQSRRQVGSTFKPIVYAAAIQAKKVTTASMVVDAPLAFATDEEFVWKPGNYGNDYLGNITLRRALQMSRNTCTVRVLEAMDPGMNGDLVYTFARKLGIGGPPYLSLPEGYVPTPENDVLCPWVREDSESTICMDRYPPKDPNLSNTAHRARLGPDDVYWCRACDMSMGLGSASLTMEELVRAYSAFATSGLLVEPYYVEEVRDRHGEVLETHEAREFTRVMEPEVASITTWLLRGVVEGGTGFEAGKELGLVGLAGKTGTTNDEKDAWFVGFTNDVITAVWVGFDQPRTLGVSSTGGRTALPIWIDYMRAAAPKERDRPFELVGDFEWANIDEETGKRVSTGGRAYPFITGTAPEATGFQAGQLDLDDLTTEI